MTVKQRHRFAISALLYIYVSLFSLTLNASPTDTSSEAWLIGKWELYYDPDGGKKDFIEFTADGDAISRGPLGKLEGFYLLSAVSVKAVFTYREKDFIMTFFFDQMRDELRIVTSHTGRESIYKKIK